MSTEKHSPGPWRWTADEHQHSGWLVDARGAAVIRSQVDSDYDDDLPTSVNADNPADARLIAAAPELLALVRELADAIGQTDRGEPDVEDRARALLDRIDGKTT